HDGNTIIKAVSIGWVETASGEQFEIYTRRVDPNDLRDADAVSKCPVLLQELVPKRRELRVTVVGDSVFCTAITPADGTRFPIDWRAVNDTSLRYEATTLGRELENRCVETTRRYGLVFSALDLVETPSGDIVFLELNSNGQWAWIELETGQPISKAFVD